MRSTVITGRARANRRYSLIGACGLLAITVIQVPRLADLWGQMKSQQAETALMLAGLSETAQTQALAEQLTDVEDELQAIETKMVGIDQMPSIQSELMELARACGCQLRKAAIQSGSSLNWESDNEDERAMREAGPPLPTSGTAAELPLPPAPEAQRRYRLMTEQLGLTLTGSLPQTLDFLDRVSQQPWLMRVAQINWSHDGSNDGHLIVEANLAFHKLARQEQTD